MKKNIIITATNSLYFDSLLTLISSIHEFSFDIVDEIIVFDLGLKIEELNKLKKIEKVKVLNFSTEERKSHSLFMSPKQHVYKLTCLENASKMGENVLWLDSGVCALSSIKSIFEKIEKDDIFFVIDTHLTKTYTHKNCQDIMGASQQELDDNIISSGIFGFKADGKYRHIIKEAHAYSLIEGCCDGDQENHRHDQSMLSILKSRYNCPSNDIEIYGYWTDMNRNIQTAKQKGAVIFVHRKGHVDIKNVVYKIDDCVLDKTEQSEMKQPKYKINLIDANLTGQEGLSKHISPQSGWGRNIENDDYEIAIYTDTMCFNKQIDDSKVNFAWLIEPPVINGENYTQIVEIQNKFKKIFSHHFNLKDKVNNFEFIPHGGTWLKGEDVAVHEKNKNINFIYSDKQWKHGHRLRHTLAEHLKNAGLDVDHYGSGSENKIEVSKEIGNNYRFSIVIENSIENDYFTEKIIDCFLAGTIPIYWGTRNIKKYFNEDGIIFLPDSDEWGFDFNKTIDLLKTLNDEYYQSKMNHILDNFRRAKNYIHPEKFINDHINANY
jgi:hypothetical protein